MAFLIKVLLPVLTYVLFLAHFAFLEYMPCVVSTQGLVAVTFVFVAEVAAFFD